jgi:hypothetical protein
MRYQEYAIIIGCEIRALQNSHIKLGRKPLRVGPSAPSMRSLLPLLPTQARYH